MIKKSLVEARKEHEEALKKLGVDHSKRDRRVTVIDFPNYDVSKPGVASVSNNLMVKGGFRNDILNDHKWRKDKEEKASTIEAMEMKAKAIAPAFNKGGLQYITPKTNPHDIGKKK
jgi:hypothetical protein